jgi:GT2 family glycosyltransferase
MRLSVIIVNWNTREDLDRCLASLAPQVGPEDEVIVVDNASRDGSAAMVRARHPGVRLIEPGRNLGYAEGSNLGVSRSSGEALLLLNPDTAMPPDGVSGLLAALDRHPRAALVAPRLVLPDGTTQASVRGMPEPAPLFAALTRLDALAPYGSSWAAYRLPDFDYDVEQPAPQPMASAWLVRREAWNDVGAFDETFPLFWNDVDWCLRARAAGWEIWYTPEVVVQHRHGASTRQVRSKATWESHRALVRFYRKHYASRLGPAGLLLAAGSIYAVGAVRALWDRAAALPRIGKEQTAR